MSYTGDYRVEFTQGQKVRANDMMNFYLGDYYQNNVCNSLNDKVEVNGSEVGLGRVAVKVIPTEDVLDESRAVTDAQGYFYGKLQNSFAIPVKAEVVKFGDKSLLTYTPEEWLKGITTIDLALISKHILGISQLNGYGQLAADANKSGSVTSFDVVELRKLILGIYDKLPNYTQPWRFVPEVVTTFDLGGLNPNFDGVGTDNPFDMDVLGQRVVGAPYTEPGWPYKMRRNRPNNGFDAVKIGDVNGSYLGSGEAVSECEEPLPVLVPSIPLNQGETVALQVKGYQLQNVVGFQLGFAASSEDFEYLGTTANGLEGFAEADAVGGLRLGKDNLKVLWLSEGNTTKTFDNGNVIFSLQLTAKRPIANLSQALKADNKVLPNLFVGATGNCKSGGSLELVLASGAEGRENAQLRAYFQPKRIFCLPNPAQEEATLLYDALEASDAQVFFHDAQGRLLDIMDCRFTQGRNAVRLQNLARLPEGIVNISVNDKTGIQSVRIIKQ